MQKRDRSCIHVLVNADDFGYCVHRNEGIAESFTRGMTNSATILVNSSQVADAFERALQLKIPIGLHLNLTEGVPIANASKISSLLDKGEFLGKFGLRHACEQGTVNIDHVRVEMEHQIERFIEYNQGEKPTHVDGHQHVHVIPQLVNCIAGVLVKYGIRRTRLPLQVVSSTKHPWLNQASITFFEMIHTNAKAAAKVFETNGISACDAFIGFSTQGGYASAERIIQAFKEIASSTSSVVEWMVHPGVACLQHHGDDFNQSEDRNLERQLLQDKELQKRIEEMGFTFSLPPLPPP